MTPSKQQAIQMALAGDWQNAISLNESLLIENPQDTETLNRLAFAFTVIGKTSEAKKTYQKVLDIDAQNPIALKNLKRIGKLGNTGGSEGNIIHTNNMFLEEPGKTKIIELINIAQPKFVIGLRTGQVLNLSIKRSKIFITDEAKHYIGMLPEDIGRRLIKFMSGGNAYEAYVKSANERKVIIFIKETKKSRRFANQASFLYLNDKALSIEKSAKIKPPKSTEQDDQLEEDES